MNTSPQNKRVHLLLAILIFCELIILIFTILLHDRLDQLPGMSENALKLFAYVSLFLAVLEIIFLYIVIKEKKGVIGIPFTILKNINFMITPFPYEFNVHLFMIIGGAIILLRILEILYLYQKTKHEKGIDGIDKLLFFSIMMDSIALSEIWSAYR